VLVLAAGDQNPIGLFKDIVFDDWEKSVNANFMGMLRFLHIALNQQSNSENRTVIMFAGGGTNNATERYSGYTISKIASIKMCELLDFEIDNIKFSIVGPGWVKTKIHESTLNQKNLAGDNYERTRQMVHGGAMTQMSEVIDICNWLVSQPKAVVGGRNFSLVHDAWRTKEITEWLVEDSNRYKLRRFGNEINLGEKEGSSE
jgi:NADP-dependent 3-hydroxy acid dehydrogenase YdfG